MYEQINFFNILTSYTSRKMISSLRYYLKTSEFLFEKLLFFIFINCFLFIGVGQPRSIILFGGQGWGEFTGG